MEDSYCNSSEEDDELHLEKPLKNLPDPSGQVSF